VKEFPYAYSGAEFPFFRVAMGPDRMIYGSTVLPIRFVRVAPKNGRMKDFGLLGAVNTTPSCHLTNCWWERHTAGCRPYGVRPAKGFQAR